VRNDLRMRYNTGGNCAMREMGRAIVKNERNMKGICLATARGGGLIEREDRGGN
jgi:hypothetical protein